mgnify:CR=1 FL=1
METIFTYGKFTYKVIVSIKKSKELGYQYYDIDCIRTLSKIKHKKRFLLAKFIKNGILCEDIVLNILSFTPYKKCGKAGEYVTRNFLSDNFVRIIMMNEKENSFENAKSLYLKTLQNGSKVSKENARNVFSCITYSCYPENCRECLNKINFTKMNDWGNLKLTTLKTVVIFYN